MKERPILFSAPMVRAILDGRKTQTRRIIKPQPEPMMNHLECHRDGTCEVGESIDAPNYYQIQCPHGAVGDRLWVRETWRTYASLNHVKPINIEPGAGIQYECGGSNVGPETLRGMGRVRPSIFMMWWMSRLTLEITGLRAERLQDIGAADVVAEGTRCVDTNVREILVQNYRELWESINGKRAPWKSNPWVWVVEFRRAA